MKVMTIGEQSFMTIFNINHKGFIINESNFSYYKNVYFTVEVDNEPLEVIDLIDYIYGDFDTIYEETLEKELEESLGKNDYKTVNGMVQTIKNFINAISEFVTVFFELIMYFFDKLIAFWIANSTPLQYPIGSKICTFIIVMIAR